jgi:hypothetical protein
MDQVNLGPVGRLESMGFRRAGQWELKAGNLKCSLQDCADAKNVLYAFVCNHSVLYVGKSIQTLKKRMYGYSRPGPTQRTNIKGNAFLKKLISAGDEVLVYALPDNGLLFYGGFHVNLAAGLEDSLIAQLKPAWNGAGLAA